MVGVKGASLLAAAAVATAATIDLPIIVQNTYSSVQVEIGTPPKPYRLLFDTGSASIWVVNKNCTDTSCPNGSGYDRIGYDPSASSSATVIGPYTKIPYIDGDGVGGDAVIDAFTTPDGVSPALTWNQTFLSANESSWRFITADGFLGLAFASIAETNTSTLVETLLQQGHLDQPRFGIFYGTNLSDTTNHDGVLSVGGSHEDKYVDGEVTYAPLRKEDPYQVWRTPLRSITISINGSGNTTLSTPANKKNTTLEPVGGGGYAVFDTGAGRVSVPSELVDGLYFALGWNNSALLSGDARWTCADSNSSWSMTFTMGDGDEADDASFSIAGNEFQSPLDPQCQPPFDGSDGQGFALIGAAFIRRHYSVWDFGANDVADYQPRIGFGKLKREYDYLYQ